MPKLVKKVTHDFTVISNKIFREMKLKGIDRGILGTMLSLADGWNFSIKGLAAILPDGETAIANSLKRIEKAHYLIRRRIYKNGKIVDWEYIISDEPMDDLFAEETEKSDSDGNVETVESVENKPFSMPNLDVDNLDLENHDVENQDLENPHDYKISKNKESKNKKSSDKESIYQSAEKEDFQNSENSIDKIEENRTAVTEYIRMNIDYAWYESYFAEKEYDNAIPVGEYTFAKSIDDVDMLLNTIVGCICSEENYVRIGKQLMPHESVKSRLMRISMEHIEYVLKSLMLTTTKIKNPKAYLLTALYNAPDTYRFMEDTELKHIDPAMFIPEEYHDSNFKRQHYKKTAFIPSFDG